LEEGNNGSNHIYAKVAELMNLQWSKVWKIKSWLKS
jgi:hypothetical protein